MTDKYSHFTLRIWELIWCSVVCLIGVIGNLTVLLVITKSKKVSRTSPFNIYIFALASVDFLVSLFVLPDYVLRTNIYDPPSGSKGTLMCKLLIGGFLPFWLLEVSVYLLVMICLERRKAILYPFSTLHLKPVKYYLLTIAALIFLGAFNQVPTWYGIYYNKGNSTSGNFCAYGYHPVLTLVFHFVSFFLQCFIPFVIFIVSFYQIRKRLSQMEKEILSVLTPSSARSLNQSGIQLLKKKQATIATMQLVVVAFFVCIIPNELVYMLFQFINRNYLEMNSPLFQVTVLLRYSNSCLNPILYSYRSKEFRSRLREVFQLRPKFRKELKFRAKPSTESDSYSKLV